MTNNGKTFDLVLNTLLDEDTSDIIVPINNLSVGPHMGGFAVGLEYVHFMNSVACVTEDNNRVYLDEAQATGLVSNSFIIEVPVGQYTATSLATQLQTLIDAVIAFPPAAITYDSEKGRYTITSSGGFFSNYRFTPGVKSLYQVMGLTAADLNVFTGIGGSLTFSGLVDVSGPKILVIECPDLADYGTSRIDTNFLKQIPLKAAYGTVETYQAQHISFKHLRMQSMQSIRIRLRDEHGNSFVLAKNTPFYMNLLLQPLEFK